MTNQRCDADSLLTVLTDVCFARQGADELKSREDMVKAKKQKVAANCLSGARTGRLHLHCPRHLQILNLLGLCRTSTRTRILWGTRVAREHSAL